MGKNEKLEKKEKKGQKMTILGDKKKKKTMPANAWS